MAALPRLKRFPRLADIMPTRVTKAKKAQTWQDQLRIVEMINAMNGGTDRRQLN